MYSPFEVIADLRTTQMVLAALYLRGAPRSVSLPKRNWPRVASTLRLFPCSLSEASEALHEAGLYDEATALNEPGLLDFVIRLADEGRFLTAASDGYPKRWLEVLGDLAPPALWFSGAELFPISFIGIVGSRKISRKVHKFASDVGAEAARLGYGVVSGGAVGCDTAGVQGAFRSGGSVLQLLPVGLKYADSLPGTILTACATDEAFTTGSAMERNALIYAASDLAVVAQARFRVGGTWVGATEAIRRRLCPLAVRESDEEAHRALVGLGARPLAAPDGLGALLEEQVGQLRLPS